MDVNTTVIMEHLQAALEYFNEAPGEENEKQVILEQVSGAIITIQSAEEIGNEEFGLYHIRTVADIANNLLLVKIAETGCGWYGEKVV